ALHHWTGFFRDPHVIGPWQSHPLSPPTAASTGEGQPTAAPPDDPNRPSIRFLDDSTTALRLPSLDSNYASVVDSLIDAHASQLRSMPYLIIDVRGNGGGYTGSYASIIPLLYTGPILTYGADVWASPANIAHYRELAKASYL